MSQVKKKFIEDNAIDNTKLDQSSSYDFETNNGSVKVKTPIENTDAANKDYVDNLVNTIADSLSIREVEDLTYTDTTNKVIALAHIPTILEDVLFFAYEGSTQEYNVDFAISVKDDVAYICLASDSTPPSGGSWDTENLPTDGLSEIINSGEGFTCEYLYSGSTLVSPSNIVGTQGPQGADGADGTIGVDGVQGPQGANGTDGIIGSDGVQGPQGTTGSQGLTGAQGTQGVQGAKGAQGATGSTGAQGAQGPTINTVTEPASSGTSTGIVDTITVGVAVSFGDMLYLSSDGKWYKALNTSISTAPCLRMAMSAGAANASISGLVVGRAYNTSWSLTIGGFVYISSTAGGITQTAPTTSGNIAQIIGIAYHANKILFQPSFNFVEIK